LGGGVQSLVEGVYGLGALGQEGLGFFVVDERAFEVFGQDVSDYAVFLWSVIMGDI
jgi:hypothetical protein